MESKLMFRPFLAKFNRLKIEKIQQNYMLSQKSPAGGTGRIK